MVDAIEGYWRDLTEPLSGLWRWYGGLDPEQQRSALLLLAIGVVGLLAWGMYQAHGDRVVIVLPATLARYSLILLALPFVLVGRVAGARWSVPEFLRRDWTAEEDPDRPRIPVRTVDPMKLPGDPWAKAWARLWAERKTRKRRAT